MHVADSKRPQGIAAVVLCSLLWSTGGLFIKLVPWNPFAIAGIRSLFAGLVMLAWLRRPHLTWSRAQVAAAVFYAATMITFVIANKLTTSANAILLQYGAPVYAALLAAPLLGERTHWYDWLTIAATLGGMVLFFLDKLSAGSLAGNLIAVANGLLFAFAMVLLRKQKDGSPFESIMLSQFLTFAVSIPFLFSGMPGTGGTGPAASGRPALIAWLALICLGVVQMGLSSILLAYGVRHVTTVQSFLFSMIEPIFNPVWVFLLLGEKPGVGALAGGAVILVATTLRFLLPLLRPARPGAT
ncbi:MAG: DMT family transporter [Spirochaetes bacterium]|nr:DMT family transporter [Spirochaetota bacterium]